VPGDIFVMGGKGVLVVWETNHSLQEQGKFEGGRGKCASQELDWEINQMQTGQHS